MACFQLGLPKESLMKNFQYKKFGQEIGVSLNNINLEDENGIIFPDRDYTDMLVKFVERGISPKLDFLFIDEAQDLSYLQWQAVEKLALNAKETYIAGDDDQAIFRWAGADVEHFINMKGNSQVLTQSYRVPKLIHSYSMRLLKRIKKRRIKTYLSRDYAGDLQFHRSPMINIEKNQWLVLATTNYILNKIEEDLIKDGIFFKRKERFSVRKSTVSGILNWESLRRGNKCVKEEIKKIYSLMKENIGYKQKHKGLPSMPDLKKFSIDDLIKNYGLLTRDPWKKALSKIPLKTKIYIDTALRKKEDIYSPRVKMSTVHGAKGSECDNVIMFTDLSREAEKQYYLNSDDLTRVMYVGATRAKRALHIITPQTTRGFLV